MQANSTAAGGLLKANTLANGSLSYNGGGSFDIQGTLTSTAYTLMLVSWDGTAFSTFAQALAAKTGSIGWSAPIQVTSGTSAIDNTVVSAPFSQFGTFTPVAAVPEPGTMVLAGLGGLAMLGLRRKK